MSALIEEVRRAWRALCRRGGGCVSVRSCLLAVVAACVLPAVAGVALLIVQAYRDGKAALVERSTIVARTTRARIDEQIGNAMAVLQVLATSPSLVSGDLAAFHGQAKAALPFQPGNNFVLSSLAGHQLVNTLVPYGSPLPMHGNPSLQRAAIETGKAVVSDLFIGGVTRRPLVAVEVPVHIDGRLSYTLAMGFFPDKFGPALAQQRPQPDWVIAVFDRAGIIVARTQSAERYAGRTGASALMEAMRRADQGVIETDTLEGTPVVAAFDRSPVSNWTVAVGVPRQALFARLQGWIGMLAVATLAVLVLAVGFATLVGRRIATAVNMLVEPAQALGRGGEVVVPALPLREADEVGRALQRASALLRARTEERDLATRASVAAEVQARKMTHAALHDNLTRLPNRARLLQMLEVRLQRWRDEKRPFALFFVDLDDFKPVNDRHGHHVGDKLLCSFARRLQGGVRGSDDVGRLGGDEFAALIDDVSPQEAQTVAAVLSLRLSSPYHVDHLELRVSACIGVACCPRDGLSAQALLEAADTAMYRAKAGGKGRFEMSGFGGL